MISDTVAEVFFNGWIARFGVPEKIITDQGVTNILRININRTRTTPYHPQSNGIVVFR